MYLNMLKVSFWYKNFKNIVTDTLKIRIKTFEESCWEMLLLCCICFTQKGQGWLRYICNWSVCVFCFVTFTNKLLSFLYKKVVTETEQLTLKYHSYEELQSVVNRSKIQAANYFVILNDKDCSRDCRCSFHVTHFWFFVRQCVLIVRSV